jgi:hypothetical protein
MNFMGLPPGNGVEQKALEQFKGKEFFLSPLFQAVFSPSDRPG